MKKINITVTQRINGNIKSIFGYIMPIDLKTIFKKNGLIPGVKSASNTEKWEKAGMERIVVFDDNSTAVEKLTNVTAPESFTYEIGNFTSLFKLFIIKINGRWDLCKIKENITNINWEYVLTPRNIIGLFIINIFIKNNLKSVLNNALRIIKENYEKRIKVI